MTIGRKSSNNLTPAIPGGPKALDASYHRSALPGLHSLTLRDDGPPRQRLHDRLILLALVEGRAVARYRGADFTLQEGQILLVEAGEVHCDLEKSDYRAVMATLTPDLLRALRGAGRSTLLGPGVVDDPVLLAALLALHQSILEEAPAAEQERRAGALLRPLEPLWTSVAERGDPPLVLRARRLMQERLAVGSTLTALAQSLGCAPTYLARVFSHHVGIGPHAYQVQAKVLAARAMIEAGATLAEAASRWGFSDQSHLHRHFRRRFAVAPGQYLRLLGGSTSLAGGKDED